jgi:hypothetical protein
MITIREIVAYLVAALAMVIGLVAVMAAKGAASDITASWVQAFGSIAAIVVVTLPMLLQKSIERHEARQVTLGTVHSAYSTMEAVAKRYLDPEYHTSEWWVPQWDILESALAQCPIYQCGSPKAVAEFLNFRQLFRRANEINAADNAGGESAALESFTITIMTNASMSVDRLRKALS